MNLPAEVPHGLPVSDLTQTVNQLIRYCRSITPRPSATVGVDTLANGTTFRVKGSSPGTFNASTTVVVNLDQFRVTVVPDPDGVAGEDWLLSMAGGTAQALFGAIAPVNGVEDEPVSIPEGGRCYVSLVYHAFQNGTALHVFDPDAVIDTVPPQNTAADYYFPVAVVEADGTVLQGHLGAVYLARPWNVVENPPYADEEEEPAP